MAIAVVGGLGAIGLGALVAHNTGGVPPVDTNLPPTPVPPANARIVRLPSGLSDYTAAINAAVKQAQAPGVTDSVIDFAQVYDVAGHIVVPRVPGAPRVWLMGNGRGSSGMLSTTSAGDLFSNQADDTQSIGLDFDSRANTNGHAYSSSGNGAGIWHSSIQGGSTVNFAGRFTQGYTRSGVLLTHETPRDIIGYTDGQTAVDLILNGPTFKSNATMDFDFQSNLRLWNIQHTGNRLDFYCVSGIFASSTFQPMTAGDPGFEITTGWEPSNGTTPGPFIIQDWITHGSGGRLDAAPPVGSKGYVKGRGTRDITYLRVTMTDPTQGMSLGDCTGLKVTSCKLGQITIVTQFHLDGVFSGTTHGVVHNSAAQGSSVSLVGL